MTRTVGVEMLKRGIQNWHTYRPHRTAICGTVRNANSDITSVSVVFLHGRVVCGVVAVHSPRPLIVMST